jgi:prolyl oligopeptidase
MTKLLNAMLLAGLLAPGVLMADDDPYLWLEEVESEKALEWAREQNERSEAFLRGQPLFEAFSSATSTS